MGGEEEKDSVIIVMGLFILFLLPADQELFFPLLINCLGYPYVRKKGRTYIHTDIQTDWLCVKCSPLTFWCHCFCYSSSHFLKLKEKKGTEQKKKCGEECRVLKMLWPTTLLFPTRSVLFSFSLSGSREQEESISSTNRWAGHVRAWSLFICWGYLVCEVWGMM